MANERTATTEGGIPESQGEDSIFVFCPVCNAQVLARVIASHAKVSPVFSGMLEAPEDTHVTILQYKFSVCPRCESPFLTSTETYEIPGEATVPQGESLLYPVQRPFDAEGLPVPVALAYEEARRSFRGGNLTSCVLMCRKCLEAVCRELGAARGTLRERVDFLVAEGRIDQKLAAWATELRLVGNMGAHDLDSVIDADDARDAVEFTEALLAFAFSLSRRFEAFVKRRGAREDGRGKNQ